MTKTADHLLLNTWFNVRFTRANCGGNNTQQWENIILDVQRFPPGHRTYIRRLEDVLGIFQKS